MKNIEESADTCIADALRVGHALMVCKNEEEAGELLALLDSRIPRSNDPVWQELFPTERRHLATALIRKKEVNVYSVRYFKDLDDAHKFVRKRVFSGSKRWRADVDDGNQKKPKKPRKKKPRYLIRK